MDHLATEILYEYQYAVDELIEQGMLIDSNPLLPHTTRHCTILSWSNNAHLSYLFSEYSQLDHYVAILNNRDFSFCFADGGLIQIKFDIKHKEITGHRLSYFPCPFKFTAEELQEITLAELPLLFNAEELRKRLKLISPIRFDYDAVQNDDRHAHSHVTLNKDSCRVPAYGPVSFGHFMHFVLRYFYELEYYDFDCWEGIKPRFYTRTLPSPSPHELHFETSINY